MRYATIAHIVRAIGGRAVWSGHGPRPTHLHLVLGPLSYTLSIATEHIMGMPDPFTVTMDATDAVHVCRRIRAVDRTRWPVAVTHLIPDAASARAFLLAWLGPCEGQRLVDTVGAATAVDLARGLALAVVSELV